MHLLIDKIGLIKIDFKSVKHFVHTQLAQKKILQNLVQISWLKTSLKLFTLELAMIWG